MRSENKGHQTDNNHAGRKSYLIRGNYSSMNWYADLYELPFDARIFRLQRRQLYSDNSGGSVEWATLLPPVDTATDGREHRETQNERWRWEQIFGGNLHRSIYSIKNWCRITRRQNKRRLLYLGIYFLQRKRYWWENSIDSTRNTTQCRSARLDHPKGSLTTRCRQTTSPRWMNTIVHQRW